MYYYTYINRSWLNITVHKLASSSYYIMLYYIYLYLSFSDNPHTHTHILQCLKGNPAAPPAWWPQKGLSLKQAFCLWNCRPCRSASPASALITPFLERPVRQRVSNAQACAVPFKISNWGTLMQQRGNVPSLSIWKCAVFPFVSTRRHVCLFVFFVLFFTSRLFALIWFCSYLRICRITF